MFRWLRHLLFARPSYLSEYARQSIVRIDGIRGDQS
jgi:hypothetical protein